VAIRTSHFVVAPECRLHALAFVAVGTAVDCHDGVVVAEDSGDLLVQVVQGVAMLCEDDQPPQAAGGVTHVRVVLQYPRQLFPLPVLAGPNDLQGLLLEALKHEDLALQLTDGARGGRVVDQRFLELLLLVGRQIVIVFRHIGEGFGEEGTSSTELCLPEFLFQAGVAALERLKDCFGAGRETALECRQCESYRAPLLPSSFSARPISCFTYPVTRV
jgi:hypothetical protein